MIHLFRSRVLLVVVLALGLPSVSLAASPKTVNSILAQARAAAGGDALDRVSGLHLSGRVNIAGIEGDFEQWNDMRAGSFTQTDNAGPFAGAQGFDGTSSWNQDWSGVSWIDGGKAGRYGGIATAYLVNESFLNAKKRGSVELEGARKEQAVSYDVLRATPPNGLPMDIWLDAKTHLLSRSIVKIGIQSTTFTFSKYHRLGGLQVASHFHTVTDAGNETDATVTAMQTNPPDADAHLKMPNTHPADYTIAGAGETTVPIQVIDNHVYLDVMLNGKGPYHFAFDTGGSNVVDGDVAKALGLEASGSAQGSGVGAQTEGLSFAKVSTLGIGSATVNNQYFAVLPVRRGFSVAAGTPIDGLIGFEVLARFITIFDYGRLRVTLQSPSATMRQAVDADVIPFVFNNTTPQVACQLDGISGDCTVDTGSRASLSVLSPFVAAHADLVPANATAPGINGFGIGGAAIGRLGRLRSLQMGKTVLQDLIADFSVQKKGYFANPFIAANVGGGVWRRFSVTFDYSHQLMSLVPNSDLSQRDAFDRSGLFLIAPGGKPTVADARPGTPAADAGLSRGDALVAVNGKSAASMDLLEIRRVLSGPAGTVVRITVQAKTGTERTVSLTLRDYV